MTKYEKIVITLTLIMFHIIELIVIGFLFAIPFMVKYKNSSDVLYIVLFEVVLLIPIVLSGIGLISGDKLYFEFIKEEKEK